MKITLEGVELTLTQFTKLFLDKEFYRFYYHKLILCRLDKHVFSQVSTTTTIRCEYCKQERSVVDQLQESPHSEPVDEDAILKNIFENPIR